jgi:hypothetical protein
LRALPDQGIAEQDQLINAIVKRGRWPEALRYTYVVVLPKPGKEAEEDMRPIGLLPATYRLWAAARKQATREVVTRLHDGPCQGAVDVAWDLAVCAAAAYDRGEAVAGLFLDCSKCYERVPWDKMPEHAVQAKFPPALLSLAMDMYQAPRSLQIHGTGGRLVYPGRGLVAGFGFAVHLVKPS